MDEVYRLCRFSEAIQVTDCVECGGELSLPDGLETGEIIDCSTCGAELEVIEIDPPVVESAPELEEDWGE